MWEIDCIRNFPTYLLNSTNIGTNWTFPPKPWKDNSISNFLMNNSISPYSKSAIVGNTELNSLIFPMHKSKAWKRQVWFNFFPVPSRKTFDQYSISMSGECDNKTQVPVSIPFISFHHNLTRLSPYSLVCTLFAVLCTRGLEKMKDDRIMILPTTSPHSKMCLKRMKATFEGVRNVCTANSCWVSYILRCVFYMKVSFSKVKILGIICPQEHTMKLDLVGQVFWLFTLNGYPPYPKDIFTK